MQGETLKFENYTHPQWE